MAHEPESSKDRAKSCASGAAACGLLASSVVTSTRIEWSVDRETRFPFGRVSPDPARWHPLGFPPPWPDRPWLYGVMVASANGVVAWRRRDATDDPVLAILGGRARADRAERAADRAERAADRRHMRFLRCFGDVAVGAQTVRDQPELVLTPQQPKDEPVPELFRFRMTHGLAPQPRNIVYSLFGRLPLAHPIFTTSGIEPIVVTTDAGVAELGRRGAGRTHLPLVVDRLTEPDGLRAAHQRLFADHGVRYLACEGGETVLAALHAARLLDEVFLTVTDIVIDERAHTGVLRIMNFEAEGATLIAEGRIAPDSGWAFRRWRFSER
jgi:riboflavin biosynthesis pyrimidine reductase